MWKYGLIFLFLGGCATQGLTEEEKEWRRHVDRENWFLCEKAYQQSGTTMWFDHKHDPDTEPPVELKMDLGRHMCKSILKQYWVEY